MAIDILTEYANENNIAELLNENTLKRLGKEVCDEYEIDLRSRVEWEKRNKKAMELASQVVEEKTFPWPGAANVKYPLLTEAALQFNARAYPSLLNNNDIVRARIVGEDPEGEKMNAAIRVSRHMSYQLLEEMEEWEQEFDSLLISLPIIGCMFKKTYYDPIEQRNRSEIIYPKDFVVDYYTKDMNSCPRATHVIPMTRNDIRIMVVNGIYSDVQLPEVEVESDEDKAKISGTTPPEINTSTPRKVLEQHRLYDLDEDGLEEPYVVTVDYKSRKVLRVVAAYSADDVIQDMDGTILSIPKQQYFTKYGFIPAVDGSFYDIGFGALIGPINDSVDTLINQLLDAGTLSNNNSGFVARGFRTKGGTLRFKPFEWKTINSTGDDLRKSIFPLPVREPSNVLFQLLGMMVNAGQRLASTVDSMVGENPGQNQKATTTMAVMEQGAKVFNAIHKRLHRALKAELKKLFLLNEEYLEGTKYFNVIDPRIEANLAGEVTRADYNSEMMNIIPAADSNAPTQQIKLAKAQALLELIPSGYINEQEAIARVLEAMEIPGIETIMKQPEPPKPDIDQQLDMKKHDAEVFFRGLEFELNVLKMQQDDVKMRAEVILTLAKAEAEEQGPQIAMYNEQLKALVQVSKNIGDEIKEKQKAMQSARSGTAKPSPSTTAS